jgi:hypothetical protein
MLVVFHGQLCHKVRIYNMFRAKINLGRSGCPGVFLLIYMGGVAKLW